MAKLIRIHSSVILAVFLSAPVVMAQETDPAKNDPREQPLAPLPAPLPAGKTSVLALNSPLWAGEEIQSVGNDRPVKQCAGANPGSGCERSQFPCAKLQRDVSAGHEFFRGRFCAADRFQLSAGQPGFEPCVKPL